ncbi:MAG: glycosyltransferase [Erysipelotrichaceae bacterium]|nr:glycosyltransferase [Erysipelotrichaceae bacterium]MDY5251128.1 glycosyltransferase [Erysipelotrichaceae bacterium]
MKLSVIVPMYNVENYVEECLLSLVNQTYEDMEIIVVDDGGSDNSVAIVERLLPQYPKLRMVHKANGGLSDARNYGLQFASGEYIGFIDSDDHVETTLYAKLMAKIAQGYEVAVCDIHYFFEDGHGFIMKGINDHGKDMQKNALLSPMFAWNKVYHRRFFDEGLRYPLNTWYEDTPVTTMVFAQTNKIGYVPEALIHYRQRQDSIMGSNTSKRILEIFGIMEMLRANFQQAGLWDRYHDEIEYLHIEHLRLYGMFRFIRSPYFNEAYEKSTQIMQANFPNWQHNAYIKDLGWKNRLFLKYFNKQTKKIFDLFIK